MSHSNICASLQPTPTRYELDLAPMGWPAPAGCRPSPAQAAEWWGTRPGARTPGSGRAGTAPL